MSTGENAGEGVLLDLIILDDERCLWITLDGSCIGFFSSLRLVVLLALNVMLVWIGVLKLTLLGPEPGLLAMLFLL